MTPPLICLVIQFLIVLWMPIRIVVPTKKLGSSQKKNLGREWSHPFHSKPRVGSSKFKGTETRGHALTGRVLPWRPVNSLCLNCPTHLSCKCPTYLSLNAPPIYVINALLIRIVVMYNHITCTNRRGLSTAARQLWTLHLYGWSVPAGREHSIITNSCATHPGHNFHSVEVGGVGNRAGTTSWSRVRPVHCGRYQAGFQDWIQLYKSSLLRARRTKH